MSAITVTGTWNAKRKCVDVHPLFWEDMHEIDGAEVEVSIYAKGNPAQLRAYWAMIGNIVEVGYWKGDKDSLDDYTRQGIGFGKWRTIASADIIDETGWEAGWEAWTLLTALTTDAIRSALRAALSVYLKAVPARMVWIPNSIALSRCSSSKYHQLLRDSEVLWTERLGVDVPELKRQFGVAPK